MFGANLPELLVLGIIGLLLFGKRLPDVAKNLGKGVSEFKKGLSGFQDEMNGHSARSSSSSSSYAPSPSIRRPEPLATLDDTIVAPKFEPPKSAPVELGAEEPAATETV
jgi:sec-independent protein translocase protein TatA